MTATLHGIERFIVVRSITTNDAAVRLQSEPILQGLRAIGADILLHNGDRNVPLAIDRPTCLLFHYSDGPAIDVIRARRSNSERVIVICLACDIYSYQPYINLHSDVDYFLAPTKLHCWTLASQLYKPVHFLPECIDPTAVGERTPPRRNEPGRRLVWFGYSESFTKSMVSLLPIVLEHRRRGTIERFALIVDKDNLLAKYGNPFDLELIDYDASDFLKQLQASDYTILSHFALDLTLNSYIKSPNKAITSLIAGLVPLCSNTPNYRDVLDEHGLSQFTFSSPAELDALLTRLDPVADAAVVRQSDAAAHLMQGYSTARICERFLAILGEHVLGVRHGYESLAPKPLPPELLPPPPTLRLKQHLRDLVPSAIRSVRERLEHKPPR